MLGNKLFIVCEYMPYSLLQLLEGTAEPSGPSATPPLPGQLWQHGLSMRPCHSMLQSATVCSHNILQASLLGCAMLFNTQIVLPTHLAVYALSNNGNAAVSSWVCQFPNC